MTFFDLLVLGLLFLALLSISLLLYLQYKLKQENKQLKKILEVKDLHIANHEASRVTVQEVVDNFLSLDVVMSSVQKGESKASISQRLSLSKESIERIIKLDKIVTRQKQKDKS